MPIDPQAQAFVDAMIASGEPPLHELTPEQARAIPDTFPEILGPGPEVAVVRDVPIPGPAGEIPARVYEPVEDPPATVVYYHGGGWVIGTLDAFDASARVLARESGCRVVSADYRLAPEHPYPAAVEDAFAAARWAAAEFDGPLVVSGDSAGGNLAAVVALRARDEGGPEIAYQVLVYPVVDAGMDTPSMEEYAEAPLVLNRLGMRWFWDYYAPDPARRSEPWASPLRAESHAGLPPAYVLVAQHDPLRDEGLAYAEKLKAAGVPVTVRRYDDQIHVFFTLVNVVDAATTASREIGRAIRAAVGAS
jgi:acetyl esterase